MRLFLVDDDDDAPSQIVPAMARTKLSLPVRFPQHEEFTKVLLHLGIPLTRSTAQLRQYLPSLLRDITLNWLDEL